MAFYLTTLLLGPILLWRGKATRRRVPRLPEAAGDRIGTTGEGPPLRLLIVGDSAAAGVGAEHQTHALLGQIVSRVSSRWRVDWRLEARTGETTATALKALLVSDARSFDVAVTSLGVNDAIALVSRRRWRQRQAELRQLLRDRFGVQYLLISGLPPVDRFPALPQPLRWHFGGRASQLNADLAADVRNEPDCRFIDLRITDDVSGMASDGFHPGPDIYAQWGRTVAQTIIDLYR